MKKFFASFSIPNLRENISRVFSRFPIALALMIGIAILLFMSLHGKFDTATEHVIFRLIFSAIVTFFFSVGISLHAESWNVSRLRNYLLQIIPVAFGGLFYTGFTASFDNERDVVFFALALIGIMAYLFFAPFIKKLYKKDASVREYYSYFYTTGVVFLISAILGGVLALLGNIAIWSVQSLFDLKDIITEKTFGDWVIIALSILAPFFALTKLPARDSFDSENFSENAFFSFLVKYIAIPFIIIYFIILYAYTGKVLANFSQWPKGEVCWMVVGFSLFGYLVYILSYVFEDKIRFIRFFRKFFPMVVIPQIAMLGYAIYLRIAQYDITMNRYFVVVFGLWLLTVSLYLLLSRRKYLAYIPMILAIFTIVISVGPWSVYELPIARQTIRLEHNLTTAKILQTGKIVPLKTYGDIDKALSKEIYEGIQYLCDFDDCASIKALFPDQYEKIVADSRVEFERQKVADLASSTDETYKKSIEDRTYELPNKWLIVSKLTEMIKVQTYYGAEAGGMPYLSFRIADTESIYPLDIRGYSRFYRINDAYKSPDTKTTDRVRVDYDAKTQSLVFKQGEKTIETIDLRAKIRSLQEGYKKTRELQLHAADMTYTSGEYKIIFENLEIKNPEYTGTDTNVYNYINGLVLAK